MPPPWVAGVSSGLSVHLGIDVKWIRLFFVASSLFGAGLILYVWLWITVSHETPQRLVGAAPVQMRISRVAKGRTGGQLLLAGGGLILIAAVIFYGQYGDTFDLRGLVPLAGIIGGLVMVWTQVPNLSEWRSPKVISLIASGTTLVVVSAVILVGRDDSPTVLLRGALIGIVVLVGVALALAPIWFGLVKNLSTTRENAARETERADIAAHLHDSVLQTLTLIRASADEPARVRSLALSQERELRSWLYTGHGDVGSSLAEALREQIGVVEQNYGIEIDIVTVGDLKPGPSELAAVAAAGEAANNAIKHGSPPVSVYMEVVPSGLDLFVKDAGRGFDPSSIPADRHGVNDSIIGRVTRVGGKVSIRTGETDFKGTEVRIHVPRSEREEKQ
jgi:Signal transduction histidine kinase